MTAQLPGTHAENLHACTKPAFVSESLLSASMWALGFPDSSVIFSARPSLPFFQVQRRRGDTIHHSTGTEDGRAERYYTTRTTVQQHSRLQNPVYFPHQFVRSWLIYETLRLYLTTCLVYKSSVYTEGRGITGTTRRCQPCIGPCKRLSPSLDRQRAHTYTETRWCVIDRKKQEQRGGGSKKGLTGSLTSRRAHWH